MYWANADFQVPIWQSGRRKQKAWTGFSWLSNINSSFYLQLFFLRLFLLYFIYFANFLNFLIYSICFCLFLLSFHFLFFYFCQLPSSMYNTIETFALIIQTTETDMGMETMIFAYMHALCTLFWQRRCQRLSRL